MHSSPLTFLRKSLFACVGGIVRNKSFGEMFFVYNFGESDKQITH